MNNETTPPIVPKEFGGKWIAWNSEKTAIVASGETLEEALRLARQAGATEPILAKVPRSDVRFLGGVR